MTKADEYRKQVSEQGWKIVALLVEIDRLKAELAKYQRCKGADYCEMCQADLVWYHKKEGELP
jgi:hypothetical protein